MQKGAVTLLDILGWKGIWQRTEKPMENLIELIKQAETNAKKFQSIPNTPGKINPFSELDVKIISISDSIVLVTNGDCEDALGFHAAMSLVIIVSSLLMGIPVRGATCYGSFNIEGSILVGPAIDEVASWYESADWIGVILTPSAYYQYNNVSKYQGFLVDYDVPIKGIGKYKTKCVSWAGYWQNAIKEAVAKETTAKEAVIKEAVMKEAAIKEVAIKEATFKEAVKEVAATVNGEFILKQTFLKMGGPITPDIAIKFSNTLNFYNYTKNLKKENTH